MNNTYQKFLDSHILVNSYNYGELISSQIIQSTLDKFEKEIKNLNGVVFEKDDVQFYYYYPEDLNHEQFQVSKLIRDLLNDKLIWFKYCEYYAKLCLEKAADECITDYTYVGEFTSKESLEVETYVIRSSITNIELPNHE